MQMTVELATARSAKEGVRVQSGCIPYRKKDGITEVLLVKKKTKQAWWGFCKGGLEPHLSKRDNAAKECFEEAGVTGTVTKGIGKFEYRKDNLKQVVHMYAMEFHVELDSWPEQSTRTRKWFTLAEARDKLSREHHGFLEKIGAL